MRNISFNDIHNISGILGGYSLIFTKMWFEHMSASGTVYAPALKSVFMEIVK
jgi:hypothetical protein